MKNLIKIFICLFILSFALPFYSFTSAPESVKAYAATIQTASGKDLRGVWVATVVNIDYPSKPTMDAEQLRNEAITILDHAKDMGLNAVFLQVRPTADALYPSSYYPWSKYLTGAQGIAPSEGFDPLAFWVTEAHNRGMELHAWINPYRITKKEAKDPKWDVNSLDPNNPARLHPDWVVAHNDGNLYFNPGLPEVRKLIVDSTMEIVNHYAVDGIHMDDYFYPGKNFEDQATFQVYKAGYSNIDDWRRANVDTLVGDLHNAIQASGKNVRFGISPFGIWANKSSNALGSDTKGTESYNDHYADTRKWVKEGMVDYIVPQIYWQIGYGIADYSKLLTWWKNIVNGTGVDLYIGQAAYRAGVSDSSSPWYGNTEIEKQMKLNMQTPGVSGSIFFSYRSFINNPSLGATVKAIYQQRDGVTSAQPVDVTRPEGNMKTRYSQLFFNGSSDPSKPLYVNGQPVENRSSQGYFGILLPLGAGPNLFTFSQDGTYESRVIYRSTGSSGPQKMARADVAADSTFPWATEYRRAGEKILLSCDAPIGAKVTVKLGGKTYTMKPETTKPIAGGVYPTTYTYVYTMPAYNGAPRVVDLGIPVYTMNYKGVIRSRKADGMVGVIMKDAPYYAKVIKDVADTYRYPESGNGAAYELYSGMTDYITGMSGGYVRLSSGPWIKKTSVTTYTSKSQLRTVIRNSAYETGTKWDTLQMDIPANVAVFPDFDGKKLTLTVSAVSSAPSPVLPDSSLFSSVVVKRNEGNATYTFALKENQRVDGYYVEKTASGIQLKVKRHIQVSNSTTPLAGLTIMVDPGHGGSETGAIGPMAAGGLEKDINLQSGLKLKSALEALGAKVLMTRTTDTTISLESRLAASRNAKPDMFISVHANSMEDNVDISKISGFSAFYRESLAKPLADLVYNKVIGDLNRNTHGVRQTNFYVNRGTWTPSILVESGFLPNPQEFEWLKDGSQQTLLAKSISEAIVQYFQN